MPNVIQLNRAPADSAVLRRLPHLSADALRFVVALLAYRSLTGRTGLVRVSEIMDAHGIDPCFSVIDELLDAGVMGQRDDGTVVYHPIILSMMPPTASSAASHCAGNVVDLSRCGHG